MDAGGPGQEVRRQADDGQHDHYGAELGTRHLAIQCLQNEGGERGSVGRGPAARRAQVAEQLNRGLECVRLLVGVCRRRRGLLAFHGYRTNRNVYISNGE